MTEVNKDALALAVAKNEAERILHVVKQLQRAAETSERLRRQSPNFTTIEVSARRILAEIDNTNV